jgi:TrbL/VirB6 plasmid conjugal transfer protein
MLMAIVRFHIIVLLAAIVLLLPSMAVAQLKVNSGDCQYKIESMTSGIIDCVDKIVKQTLPKALALREKVAKAVGVLLFIAIVIYGMRIVWPGQYNLAETYKQLLVICIVMMMVLGTGGKDFIDLALDFQKGLMVAMGKKLGFTANGSNGGAWQQVDCFLAKMMMIMQKGTDVVACNNSNGGNSGTGGLVMGLAAFAALIFAVFAMMPVVAVIFAVMMMSLLIVIYVIGTYIVAMLALLFLVMVMPLVLPMALISQTRSYAHTWLSFVVAYTLMPGVLMGCFSIAKDFSDQFYTRYTQPMYNMLKDAKRKTQVQISQSTSTYGVSRDMQFCQNGELKDAGGASLDDSYIKNLIESEKAATAGANTVIDAGAAAAGGSTTTTSTDVTASPAEIAARRKQMEEQCKATGQGQSSQTTGNMQTQVVTEVIDLSNIDFFKILQGLLIQVIALVLLYSFLITVMNAFENLVGLQGSVQALSRQRSNQKALDPDQVDV